jgi:plastocyanin
MNPRAAYSFSCAVFALVVASASLAGCFSERVAGTEPPAGDLCEGTPANVIQIRNFAFVQNNLTVSPGTKVTWVNCDTETHTSTSDAASLWDSGALTPGSRFERTFTAAGSFPYHCTPHPSMKGTVVVQ